MVSVEEALQLVLNSTHDMGVEKISFLESANRVLREPIHADRDFPPFNRVSMDGIAINHRFFAQGIRDFHIEAIQAAGAPKKMMKEASHCMEVMTGAILPANTDTVIRYEDVSIRNGKATVALDTLELGKNIHSKGKDTLQGEALIEEHTLISAAEMGVFASVGKTQVEVARIPKIMIVSTGDELVEVHETPETHQIRRSNVFTLVSLLGRLGLPSETDHINDRKPTLKQKIKAYLQEFDVLLFSGAVSKGKFDFLPQIFDELGVEKCFHRVSQRPGKPFFFGKTTQCTIFGFPGNPISTYVNCLVYFYPWFAKVTGFDLEKETAILGEDVCFRPPLTYFLQVRMENKKGRQIAFPVKGNGSGDLVSLVNADGFIQLPKEKTKFKKGEPYLLHKYRNF